LTASWQLVAGYLIGPGANLYGAVLPNEDLIGANLSGADLRITHLETADLNNADPSLANLSNARLNLTNLSGADLSGAEMALAFLERAVDIPGLYVNLCVKLQPMFDSLRAEPRFDAVLAGMNLAD